MILDLIQNPHYVIDINSYEGIRNIVVTILVFVSILVLGRNLSKSKNLLILKIICTIAIISTGYDHIIDAINGNWIAWIYLLVDVLLGLISFLIYHFF